MYRYLYLLHMCTFVYVFICVPQIVYLSISVLNDAAARKVKFARAPARFMSRGQTKAAAR